MKVLLVQVDGKMPNLALMKISTWHKRQSDKVYLNDGCSNPDMIHVSCLFSQNAPKTRTVAKRFPCKVRIGGYGFGRKHLPSRVEHIMPDYELYDIDYSMGFTSRGCIRNCPWCIVPKMEGSIRDHAPISEFLHPDHDKLILLDNNFLASPKWKENLGFIISNNLKVNFNQGLDIRLVNEENAGMLADCKFYNWHFKFRQLHFAFDRPEIELEVKRGVEILKSAGIMPRKLMFYMLTNFNTTFEQDWHRFQLLRELSVDPFVMKYNGTRDDPLINHFTRWVNKRIYKVCDFRDYDYGNSQETIKNNGHVFEHPKSLF